MPTAGEYGMESSGGAEFLLLTQEEVATMLQMLHGAPSMPFPWDGVQSLVRLMLNNRVAVNRLDVWDVYMQHAHGVMVMCFYRGQAHLIVLRTQNVNKEYQRR